MNRKRRQRQLLTMIVAATLMGVAATAPAVAADFYAGKNIEILVGSAAGGGFDIYARALARHWSKFIAGHPTIVVRNMPGAGGARSAAYVSTVAPKDGTVLAAPMPGAIVAPLLEDNSQAGFDPAKLQYLGTADSGVRVCVTMDRSKVKTAADAQTTKAIMGATQAGGSSSDYAYMHRHTSNAKFDVVMGYQAMTDTSLAMERGELDGTCGWDWSSLKSMKPDWIRDKRVNILFQVGLQPDPELTAMGVPEIWKYRELRGRPQSRRVGRKPAGVHAFLRRAAGDAAGASRHAAHGLRPDHEGSRIPERRRTPAAFDQAAVRRQGAGSGAADVLHAQGNHRPHQARHQPVAGAASIRRNRNPCQPLRVGPADAALAPIRMVERSCSPLAIGQG